ncbi:MAG: 50S ribosomal protein L4 [Rhabdochlamydiaceae bacterium]
MAIIKTYNLQAKEIGEVSIDDHLIKAEANLQMIKDYLVALRANARQWSAHTQTRAEVNHSGKKPHAQKGTGKARQGYLGAPHYRGGGRVHSPRAKFDQHIRINKKEKRAAIRHLISEKIMQDSVRVLKLEDLEQPRTKLVWNFLEQLNLNDKRVVFLSETFVPSEENLFVQGMLAEKYDNFIKSMRNIPKVEFKAAAQLSGYDIVRASQFVVLESAVDDFINLLGGSV